MLKQTKGYVEAISGSITAAKKGHALASECLGAIDELLKDPNTKGSVESMLKIGRSALEIANGALDGFRRVRHDLHQVRAIYSLRELCWLFLLIPPPQVIESRKRSQKTAEDQKGMLANDLCLAQRTTLTTEWPTTPTSHRAS